MVRSIAKRAGDGGSPYRTCQQLVAVQLCYLVLVGLEDQDGSCRGGIGGQNHEPVPTPPIKSTPWSFKRGMPMDVLALTRLPSRPRVCPSSLLKRLVKSSGDPAQVGGEATFRALQAFTGSGAASSAASAASFTA